MNFDDSEHDMTQEVIALLMPDTEAGPSQGPRPAMQALVRREDGAVVLEDVTDETALADEAIERFQQAVPIRCPVTREVIGYEMQPVAKAN